MERSTLIKGSSVDSVLEVPGFEGFEKRLELEVVVSSTPLSSKFLGLREMSCQMINDMLNAASCTIVSQLSNEELDSYVLSESSLFIYPLKIILKTCGTTQILKAIPKLLDASSKLSLKVCRCKYTRGTFLFPEAQPHPYRSFGEETSILEEYCGKLGLKGVAYVMEDPAKVHNWHIYVATVAEVPLKDSGIYTIEMCMTQLGKEVSSTFFKDNGHETAAEMTQMSGIRDLLPNCAICDFAFDPCGYSMNGIEGSAHTTIHVTPEEGFSYASFEAMGYGPETIDLHELVNRVTSCFKPACFSLSIYIRGADCGADVGWDDAAGSWEPLVCLSGYFCVGTTRKDFPDGSAVLYRTYKEGSYYSSSVRSLEFTSSLWNLHSVDDVCGLDLVKRDTCMGSAQLPILGM